MKYFQIIRDNRNDLRKKGIGGRATHFTKHYSVKSVALTLSSSVLNDHMPMMVNTSNCNAF